MTDLDQVTALADSFNLPLLFGEIKVMLLKDSVCKRMCMSHILSCLCLWWREAVCVCLEKHLTEI